MTKIDKFLYGGFAVVALAGIVAMLVTVFSPPKQTAEEAVETPQTEQATMKTTSIVNEPAQPENGTGEYWFDENGNKVWFTQEQLDAGSEYEQELKRQEEEQKALDEAEKKWWESRQDWVERFPFEPTPHPEITFDPDAFRASREMRDLARNHSLLKMFYESWVPYTEEFEQMYDIVKEELGEVGSTVALAVTFRTLAKYHKASQRDPDSIYRENVQVRLPDPEPLKPLVELVPDYHNLPLEKQNEIRTQITDAYIEERRARRNMPKYEVRDVTWGEETEMMKRCLLGPLEDLQIDGERIPEEQALAIRERLINEIPAEGFLELPELIWAYNGKYMGELKAGDPLLVK